MFDANVATHLTNDAPENSTQITIYHSVENTEFCAIDGSHFLATRVLDTTLEIRGGESHIGESHLSLVLRNKKFHRSNRNEFHVHIFAAPTYRISVRDLVQWKKDLHRPLLDGTLSIRVDTFKNSRHSRPLVSLIEFLFSRFSSKLVLFILGFLFSSFEDTNVTSRNVTTKSLRP